MSMLDAPAGDVAAYAADVRRALADLTPDQVDDLTDDLEIALTDAMSDDHRAKSGTSLTAMFGTPEQYAAELRAAAGLAPGRAGRSAAHGALHDVAHRVRNGARDVVAPLRAQPWWPGFSAFMRSLAPLWWVVRGWVVYAIVGSILGLGIPPRGFFAWLVLLAVGVVSVQWGRGLWRRHTAMRLAWRITSVVAVVVALPLIASGMGERPSYDEPDAQSPADGVWVGGSPAENLFVYDAAGNPVPNAQIYDSKGDPVEIGDTTTGLGFSDDSTFLWLDAEPGLSQDGRQRWNVYPLRGTSADDPDAPAVDMPWPFDKATAVVVPDAAAAPSAAPDASGEPAVSPAPASSGAPAPTGKVAPSPTSTEAPAPASSGAPAPTSSAAAADPSDD